MWSDPDPNGLAFCVHCRGHGCPSCRGEGFRRLWIHRTRYARASALLEDFDGCVRLWGAVAKTSEPGAPMTSDKCPAASQRVEVLSVQPAP